MRAAAAMVVWLGLASAVAALDLPGEDRRVWLGPGGEELPFGSEAEVLEFLLTADVVSSTTLDKGVNRPAKVLLEKDGVRAHAVFRTVRAWIETGENTHWKIPPTFRDHFLNECAAYELSRLLGLELIPPVVERWLHGRRGSLQLWIEQAIDEEKRRRLGVAPADWRTWSRQMESMVIFDALIHNRDRNQGNILLDARGEVWLIDHTQSFGEELDLLGLDRIPTCYSDLGERMRILDRDLLLGTLSPYLPPRELEALLLRRDRLVTHLDETSLERGCR